MSKTVLVVAGSDSSGGAGISADITALNRAGVSHCLALTAVTAQDPSGVSHTHATPEDSFAAQLAACRTVDAVKVGMLTDASHVHQLTTWLSAQSPPLLVVLDPVLASTSGGRLLDDAGIAALWSLLPYVTLLTPNRSEAEILAAGAPVEDWAEAMPCAVLLTCGDDGQDPIEDVLFIDEEEVCYEHARVTGNFRGTGCALSSHIAAELAKGTSLDQAIGAAIQDLSEWLSHNTP